MSIRIGDRVDLLDEAVSGRVTDFLDRDRVMVELEEGFEHPYPIDKLVKREESEAIPYGKDEQFQRRVKEKENKEPLLSPQKGTPRDKLEIDLHIEELYDRPLQLSNSDILRKQIAHCHARLEWARRERIPRVIIIHGVGEGVLKTAVRDLLDRDHSDLFYFDAPMQEYGRGATEVRLPV